jgi:hypothetical protein
MGISGIVLRFEFFGGRSSMYPFFAYLIALDVETRGEIKRDEYLEKGAISPLETRFGGGGAHLERGGSNYVPKGA